jgi:hypothetical protein
MPLRFVFVFIANTVRILLTASSTQFPSQVEYTHRTALTPSLALRRILQRQQRKQATHNRPVLEVYTRVTNRISMVTTVQHKTPKEQDDTHSPELASYKSVKAPFVLVVPSQAAIVEMNRSLSSGDETAAMYSSQSSATRVISIKSPGKYVASRRKQKTHS